MPVTDSEYDPGGPLQETVEVPEVTVEVREIVYGFNPEQKRPDE